MILKFAVDQKWFYVCRVGKRSFAKYGFETKEDAELAMIVRVAKESRKLIFETVRLAADQTEIVFPTLSRELKDAYKLMTKRYPRPLIADLIEREEAPAGAS